jgi:hypothetical protein
MTAICPQIGSALRDGHFATSKPFSLTNLNLFGLNATATPPTLILRCTFRMVNVALVWLLTYLQYGTNQPLRLMTLQSAQMYRVSNEQGRFSGNLQNPV